MSDVMAMKVDAAIRSFFDTKEMDRSAAAMNRRSLSKIGAFVRTNARGRMRPGGKKGAVSRPGQSPRTHKNPLLKKFLFFVYDPKSESVVIGPALLNQVNWAAQGVILTDTVPAILEYGGNFSVHEFRRPKDLALWMQRRNKGTDPDRDWGRVDRRFRSSRYAGAQTRWREVGIKPRPFMRPAFNEEMPKFAYAFRGEFKKAA